MIFDEEKHMTGSPVLVTTEFRWVFFGYSDDTTRDPIVLRNARNCIYWPATTGGFGGLACYGPGNGARIGPPIPQIILRKITAVADVTPAAVAEWEAANVYRG
jgi:hypothetical protein